MRVRLPLLRLAAYAACLSGLLAGGAAFADEAEHTYRDTLICYGELNYTCAVERSYKAEGLERHGASRPERLIEILRTRAYAHAALDQTEAARADFLAILAIQPAFTLNGEVVSPKIRRAFLDAQAEFTPPAVPAPAKPVPPPPPTPPAPKPAPAAAPPPVAPAPVLTRAWRAALTAEMPLQASDRRAFWPGLRAEGGHDWRLAPAFTLGAAASVAYLPARHADKGLLMLDASAVAALQTTVGGVDLRLPLGLGLGGFGYDALDESVLLFAALEPEALFRLADGERLGIRVGPRVYWRPSNRVSVLLSAGLSYAGWR